MTDALIGHTGFVGQILQAQKHFSAVFNSSTIDNAAQVRFDTLFCAAAPGSMFDANRFPDRDTARMDNLIRQLGRIHADEIVLISSIAVLKHFDGEDDETTDRLQSDLAYGRNRARLEKFCTEHFDRCLIVRLPALFGPGLKKNFVFDILNPVPSMLPMPRLVELASALPASLAALLDSIYREDIQRGMAVIDRQALIATGRQADYNEVVTDLGFSAVGFTNPLSQFQYYDMSCLSQDIDRALSHELAIVHLATEPVSAAKVYETVTGRQMPPNAARLHRENMHTRYADRWGRSGPYITEASQVLAALSRFVDQTRKQAA